MSVSELLLYFTVHHVPQNDLATAAGFAAADGQPLPIGAKTEGIDAINQW